jgi:hypothetical protein
VTERVQSRDQPKEYKSNEDEKEKYALALVPVNKEANNEEKDSSQCTDLVPVEDGNNSQVKRSNSIPGSRRIQPSQNPNRA